MRLCEENTPAVSLEVLHFWARSGSDHYRTPLAAFLEHSAEGTSSWWGCKYVKSHKGMALPDHREILIPSTSGSPAQTRLAPQAPIWISPLGARRQDTEQQWSWREDGAKHNQPCLYPEPLRQSPGKHTCSFRNEQKRKYLLEMILISLEAQY